MRPRWISKSAIVAIHDRLIAEHGGPAGTLSDDILEATLASPRQLLAYGKPDLFDLAAKYAAAFTLNHPFRDGNKRMALTVAGVFLEMNGHRLQASEADTVGAILALSTKKLDEKNFAHWLRSHARESTTTKPRKKKGGPHK